MPFKLKLKKTRQYNVASKSLFVISVELLDGGIADCTLSVDSTGQECLDNVCQRQAINQPEFFGLRYLNRNQQLRWVQLERPLKRQLDKHASSHQLYLRVMYYVISGTSLITDEVTRYHYFLQLKNDLVEGRIICDCQQAVVLASYSRQAEYGNHDRDRHTVDYLKNMLTFPKQIIDGGQLIDGSTLAETGRLEWLTAAVIQHHMSLHNMSQAQAEEGFITTCQQLRGYGQEIFSAKDQLGQSEVTIAISLTGIRVLTENSDTPHFYRWMDITNVINHKRMFSIECQRQAESASFALASPDDGKYVWRMCVQQHTFYMRHRASLACADPPTDEPRPNFQEHGLSESREELDCRESVAGEGSATGGGGASLAACRAHSTSCLELTDGHHHTHSSQMIHRRALLPSYRPAPDYETAVQQKYQQQRVEAQVRYQGHPSQMLASARPGYGSHPDIHRVHFPDVTRHTAPGAAATDDYPYGRFVGANYPFAINPGVQTDVGQLHYINVYKPPPPYPSNGLASNSTPDLAVASQALNYHRSYINSHVSGSSPDLVSTRPVLNRQYLGYVGGNHGVVNYSRPNILPPTHGTYNNLASVLDTNPHIIIEPPHIGENHIQKMYDDRGNIMYSMPMHRIPYQRHVVVPPTQPVTKMGEAQEPIYENVPLLWHSDGKIRDRAHSLTTTDEIARLNERNSSHPTINTYGNIKTTLHVPTYLSAKIDNADGHYVNAQVIKNVRESSVPKDSTSDRSINKIDNASDFDNVTLSVDRLSLKRDEKECDETPYQSLSTHRLSNNNTIDKSRENVTSIVVDDYSAMDGSASGDSARSSSMLNSTASTTESGGKQAAASGKEKKRRRWAVFMGRGRDVKSATLGRRTPTATPQPHRWSTGLPKSQPLPPTITKETLCQLLERKMSEDQISFAFEQIPKGREEGTPPGVGSGSVRTALLPQHAALNAYSSDQLPYEDNRVRLTPTAENPHGYINASHVTMTVGSTQRFYVVVKVGPNKTPKLTTAAPSVEQGALLWECVWQVGARIVALVGGDERPPYLPPDNTTAEYGKWEVRTMQRSRTAWGGSLRVQLRARPTAGGGARPAAGGGAPRALWHVHFARWPDHLLVPHSVEHFLGFLCEVNGLRLAMAAESGGVGAHNAPLAVVGRGGLALAADLLLHLLDTNQELDIPRTISMLHQQRANLIQNVHQYKFLHQVLLQYLKQSRLI